MRTFAILAVVALLLTGTSCRTQQPSRAQRWQSDLATFATEFPSKQIDATGRLSKAEWDQGIQQLRNLPFGSLSDAEIAGHIERLLARYHDGHIKIFTDGSSAEPLFLPIRFRWFPQGLYVSAASDPQWRGARLIAMNGTPADQLLLRIAPWVSVENESGLHAAAAQALFNTALLADAGLVGPPPSPLSLRLRLANGGERTIQFTPQPYVTIQWASRPLPLYQQAHNLPNWLQPLPEHQALYVRYAVCKDKPGNAALAQQIERALHADPTTRVIIDLRGNEGGDSAAFRPILSAVVKAGSAHHLTALTDRGTFSSAFLNAVELRERGARILGEAPAQRPVYTGDVKDLTLPYSGLKIRYTTKWSRHGQANATELTPDVTLQPSPQQYEQGEDPVLDAALRN